ncbi:L10-interacting MYB domain-containing protein isoform X1 [Cornus florida]|uniref:L10-interacting MYB domain-containing protein isoform X1 n=1 Tax=Cornus florida TaxID=4283 RepID=UPI002896D6B5|nr:L10-interacting MYB domain-containing protein isoform X1 [Cornus florida]XP_059635079.1 L10-interacting MYB domain-containing protein isoform X1 [Cornus florida]
MDSHPHLPQRNVAIGNVDDNEIEEVGVDGKKIWEEKNEKAFIDLMVEEVKKGNRNQATFSNLGWKNIIEGMKKVTRRVFTKTQLRNKFNLLRTIQKVFKYLLKQSGAHFNPTTGMVVLDDERWERLSKVIKNCKRYKRKGCKQYDKLCFIFDGATASGVYAHPSTKSPSISDNNEGPNNDDDNEIVSQPQSQSPIVCHGVERESFTGIVKVSRPRSRSPKVCHEEERESFTGIINQVLVAYNENNKRMVEVMEKALVPGSSSKIGSTVDSGPNLEAQNEKELAKITECIDALNTLDDIDDTSYVKAVERFQNDAIWRGVFLRVPDNRKKALVKNL